MTRATFFPLPRRSQGGAILAQTAALAALLACAPVAMAQLQPLPPLPQAAAPSPAHAEYMRRPVQQPASRPAQGQLDPHGRVAPNRSSEEDQLEIPAFLRRQAN